MSDATKEAFAAFYRGLRLRKTYGPLQFADRDISGEKIVFTLLNGVYEAHTSVSVNGTEFLSTSPLSQCKTFSTFLVDLEQMVEVNFNSAAKLEASRRLKQSEEIFKFHRLFNRSAEKKLTAEESTRDIHSIYMVDNCLAHSFTNGSTLLKFIKDKLDRCGTDVVGTDEQGNPRTLNDVITDLDIHLDYFTLDSLNVSASSRAGHVNSNKFEPFGNTELFHLFLEHDNSIGGRYFGELMQNQFKEIAENPYHLHEFHVRIKGGPNDLQRFAEWVVRYNLISDQVRWVIELTRATYPILQKLGEVQSFQDWMDNIFVPLQEATVDPKGHPELDALLKVTSRLEINRELASSWAESSLSKPPSEWKGISSGNPPDEYYCYYIWANLQNINSARKISGKNLIKFRIQTTPGADLTRLCCGYLLCDTITGGADLIDHPVLQNLYYLAQIGVVVSPLYEASLNPLLKKSKYFNQLFLRGLKVTLASYTPMQLHVTDVALSEEYAIAAQVYRLSSIDISELSRHSLLVSNYPDSIKAKHLGENWHKFGVEGNDVKQTNIPNCRIDARYRWLQFNTTLIDRVFQRYPEIEKLLKNERASVEEKHGPRRTASRTK
eukprot:TRINITY_DN5013_c0_g1_i5.p1 TRINITY_DN5013_c0_g1~~TRINITY_DN5013_c0_g1_i5.p1  ORF type:complete len:607 (+),score=125.32 TRINITY_DN5013_c0_g1_i5:278-2098(+)